MPRFDDVVGVEGEVADRTANGTAAVQHRRRAAKNLDAFDDFGVNVVALGFGVRAVEEGVGNFNAINLGQDSVTVDTANVVPADASALPRATD